MEEVEIAEVQYDAEKKIVFRDAKIEIPEGGLGHFLFHYMKKHGDKIAQIAAETGEHDTFNALLKKSIRTAIRLKRLGIQPGDIISACTTNHLNAMVPIIAAQLIGAITASTDPTICLEDNVHLIGIVKPKIIFVHKDSENMIREVIKRLGLDTKIVRFGEDFDKEFLCSFEDEDLFEPVWVDDLGTTAIIYFSSGTTGLPKGICLGHDHCLTTAFYEDFVMGDHKVLLGYATLYWVSSSWFFLPTVAYGFTKLVCEKFDPALFWVYAEKYKVDIMAVAPNQAIQIYKARPKIINIELKTFVIGGASISLNYMQKLRNLLPRTNVVTIYGSTEAGLLTLNYASELAITQPKLETTGRPRRGFQYRIVDPETEEICNFNESGEIRVKANYFMGVYHNQDSSDQRDSSGFFKTGDVGYYDEQFCFYVVDRVKEMFKYQSLHVVPKKIEDILEQHPAVEDVAVVGLPHAEDGNHAVGVVVLKKGLTASEDEIAEFVNSKVDARNRLVAGVRIVEKLPYTASGKLMRRALRDRIQSEER